MTYPAFYQAWHHLQLTPHPEVLETTGVGTNSEALRLNLENLPQYLRAQVANDLELRESVREICIDGYKFMVRDNPAAKIYTEMVRAGCPRCEDGTPRTMVDL
jgi:hypothetical protein